ncbi:MAG: DUF721 domain-containing protein [Puniceicoccales bacterium]|nr:DUF721 domain-containing protein [Puniceicoccales bacterium]
MERKQPAAKAKKFSFRHLRTIAAFAGLPAGRPTGHLRPILTLGEALDHLLQCSLARNKRLESIRNRWDRIVDGKLATLCWPEALAADTLVVRVASSTAAQEWTLRQEMTLERLRQIPELAHICRICCTIGPAGDADEKFPVAVGSGERRWNFSHNPRRRQGRHGERGQLLPHPAVDGRIADHPAAPASLPAAGLKLRLDEGNQQTLPF